MKPRQPRCIAEIKVLRLREEPAPSGDPVMDKPEQVVAVWHAVVEKSPWYDPEKEALVAFNLDAQLRIKGFNLVTLGLVSQTLIHVREAFSSAIAIAASHLLLGHNHPSGDSKPSADDIRATREMLEAGRILGIPLIDHVIIGRPMPSNPVGFVSLKQMGIL